MLGNFFQTKIDYTNTIINKNVILRKVDKIFIV